MPNCTYCKNSSICGMCADNYVLFANSTGCISACNSGSIINNNYTIFPYYFNIKNEFDLLKYKYHILIIILGCLDSTNYNCYNTNINNCEICTNNFYINLNLQNFTLAYLYDNDY